MNHWIGVFTVLVALCGIKSHPHEIRDGSLLLASGGHAAVRIYTRSPYSHVAIIFRERGRYWVYEANPDHGVRRIPLDVLLRTDQGDRVKLWLSQPRRKLSQDQVRRMHAYAKSQLGRPYSIQSLIPGRLAEGVHCSELVSRILSVGGIRVGNHHSSVMPVEIVNALVGRLYSPLTELPISTTSSILQMLR